MKTVFDIGVYDGADTGYYLESGYRVVAVEANPVLAERVVRWYDAQVASGQLICINKAISPDGEPVELFVSSDSLGWSSIYNDRAYFKETDEAIKVSGITLPELFEEYGVPYYLKVDIEGADRLCVLSLTPEKRPPFLSFEVGDDIDELVDHLEAVGYKGFKFINQVSFREFAKERSLYDRITRRLVHLMGYSKPQMIRRGGLERHGGRFFVSYNSSGPVPWKSDGEWHSAEETRGRLQEVRASISRGGLYDVHATLG